MNLAKLFEIQRELDERIVKDKGLEEQDLLDRKILALQVELAECANEWRGFKFWSANQQPRTEKKVTCHACKGEGLFIFEESKEDICLNCSGTGLQEDSNPLLIEYVDCLHFILSIGLDIKADDIKYENYTKVMRVFEGIGITYLEDNLTKQFGLVYYFVSGFEDTNGSDEYTDVLLSFLRLGEMLGFTWEQIEKAYYDKNKVNHERQENGY